MVNFNWSYGFFFETVSVPGLAERESERTDTIIIILHKAGAKDNEDKINEKTTASFGFYN